MKTQVEHLLSQRELAQRWSSPEDTLNHFRSQGIGPRYIDVRGNAMYPVEEIQKFERACLFFNPIEVAYQQAA